MLIAGHGRPNTLHILYDDFNGDCYIVRSVSIRTDPPTCSTVEVCEYEEIKLKEGSSTHKAVVPSGAVSVKPPVEIGVDHCPAYGINTTSPNLGLKDGPGGVDGTQSEGVYETVKQ